MGLPIARQGFPYMAAGLALAVILGAWGSRTGFILVLALTGFVAAFFRDPERRIPADKNAILSPADGRVLLVEPGSPGGNGGEAGTKISIFMSVFNCHVNRLPAAGTVRDLRYSPGRFFAAHQDRASGQNEQNALRLEGEGGREITVVQIAGLIARRIVCWVKVGDRLAAGTRFGLIQFGSRVDLYLPAGARLTVRRGDRVKAGLSVMGYWT
ncbi:MAG: phosphatidylserine decarboxylase family protein [Desulfobacterota bacterium]|jgi:phosphatidylserine decarboxylase|nr:phosphatidylserine decarboxylase family protein [Thermodesulfobacteriota bacterium]